jgi:hypothetical protein
MKQRENSFVEAMKFITERNNKLVEQDINKSNTRINEHNEFMKKYYDIKKSRLDAQKERVQLYESAQDQELATAIKGIYITALEANTLTDNGILLAEELVDKWIKNEGGAAKIIRENINKTYLLNRICTIVENAAIKDIISIYEAEDEDELKSDDKEEEKKEDDEDLDYELDDKKEESKDKEDSDEEDEDLDYELDDKKEESEDKEEDSDEEVIDDKETEEEIEVKKDNDDEDDTDSNGDLNYGVEGEKDVADATDEEHDEPEVEDELEKDFESSDDEESEEEAEAEEEIEDDTDEDIDNDGEADIEEEPENDDNEVLKDLDQEQDVKKAVALIRQRIADAEETFIKNNAKDKEQINSLLGKISDNIKTVEDMSEKDKERGKDAVAEENVKMGRRNISQITNERPLSIMEMFARNLNKDIIRDENERTYYLNEDGSLDIDTIVESAKVLYGFLETINTIQIGRKIDQNYIKEIFS